MISTVILVVMMCCALRREYFKRRCVPPIRPSASGTNLRCCFRKPMLHRPWPSAGALKPYSRGPSPAAAGLFRHHGSRCRYVSPGRRPVRATDPRRRRTPIPLKHANHKRATSDVPRPATEPVPAEAQSNPAPISIASGRPLEMIASEFGEATSAAAQSISSQKLPEASAANRMPCSGRPNGFRWWAPTPMR